MLHSKICFASLNSFLEGKFCSSESLRLIINTLITFNVLAQLFLLSKYFFKRKLLKQIFSLKTFLISQRLRSGQWIAEKPSGVSYFQLFFLPSINGLFFRCYSTERLQISQGFLRLVQCSPAGPCLQLF